MLISQRVQPGGHAVHLSYGAWNEAEDVLADSAGTKIVALAPHPHPRGARARRVVGRGVRQLVGPRTLLPATAKIPVSIAEDHVFFVAHGLWDLPLLERLRELRRNNTTISVWISEVWPSELADPRVRYECYSLIDHIFVAMAEAVAPLADIAPQSQVHFLPPAADVLRFAPDDPMRHRGISVLGIGRRDEAQHEEIKRWAEDHQNLYMFDTVRGSAGDWQEHRVALAAQYQHANVAICNYAKHDKPELIGDLRLPPGRMFEGLASGSVLVGLAPDRQSQERVVGQTVVEAIDATPGRLSRVLDRFEDQDEARPIRIRNMALACRHHDWAHRGRTAFDAIGVPVPVGVQHRIDDLEKRAIGYEELAGDRY